MNNLQNRPTFDISQFSPLLGNITPPQLPSYDYDRGLIRGHIHTIKVAQSAKSTELEATIAAKQREMVVNRIDMISALLNAGEKFKADNREHVHRYTMCDIVERKELKDIELREKEIENLGFLGVKQQIENVILSHQEKEAAISAEIAAMERDARRNAMGLS